MLEMLSENRETALKLFIEQHNQDKTEKFSLSEGKKLTDDQIKRKIVKVLGTNDISILLSKPKIERNNILRKLKEVEHLTIREIEKNTGISRGIILEVEVFDDFAKICDLSMIYSCDTLDAPLL